MNKIALGACFIAGSLLLQATSAEALTPERMRELMEQPILMQHTESSRMHVVFRHDTHLSVSCMTCHHVMTATREVFTSCSDTAACHDKMDIGDRSSRSYFVAIHHPNSIRSCRGCHIRNVEDPELKGCSACHDPEAAAARAKK